MIYTALIAIAALATAANPERATIRGEVTDSSGRPIVSARIDVTDAKPLTGNLHEIYLFQTRFAITNRDGQFEIPDLDATLQFRLLCTAPGKKTVSTEWFGANAAQQIKLEEVPADMSPERIVHFQVVDSEGQPVAYALVRPSGFRLRNEQLIHNGYVRGVERSSTDENGHFQTHSPEEFDSLSFTISADGFVNADSRQLLPGPG